MALNRGGEKAKFIPGCTLYQPHRQHIYATSFGNQVRMLTPLSNKETPDDIREFRDPRPAVRVKDLVRSSEPYIPGTQVHVPGVQQDFGETFGQFTSQDLLEHSKQDAPEKMQAMVRPRMPDPWKPNYKQDAEYFSHGKIPGYGGYVPGEQHIVEKSFGSLTKDLDRSPVKELLVRDEATRRGGKMHSEQYEVQILLENLQKLLRQDNGDTKLRELCNLKYDVAGEGVVTVMDFRAALQMLEVFTSDRAISKLLNLKDVDTVNYNDVIECVHALNENTRVVGNATVTDGKQHLPGYGGFLPNTSRVFAKTFGTLTYPDLTTQGERVRVAAIDRNDVPRQLGILNTEKEHTELKNSVKAVKNHHLPGYTGHVEADHLTFSHTFGDTTRRLNTSPNRKEVLLDDERHIKPWMLPGNNGEGHMSGYAGFVPGFMDSPPGKTFKETTSKEIFTDMKIQPKQYIVMHARDSVIKGKSSVEWGDRRLWNNNYMTTTASMMAHQTRNLKSA
eukprot:TRINITY_DN7648_c0_g1::TRINITY_DN7648_c0_g1_i1::g.18549::m.18549 TRINITY_DN7648_c0_g1::TRINITY_DN7648_c0_g1_i1::g.18549  ORF type:complete len:571 (-),score=96.54,sp/A8MTA8/F166B_HUMAN/27.10/3e-09,DUF2475/PF10629.4/4.3,DUF2475/PF10629.4/2.4e+02,DUF2475/PF10629.4/7e-06,DUF2475/PF10629.4/0.0018,DUF2475/PF10629.4/0.0051,DUF2475/PF10629.4/0.0004,DUF2475/PF10629.4/0.073 TRINITY_DN7648_c0_g1_i1:121-1632(-)